MIYVSPFVSSCERRSFTVSLAYVYLPTYLRTARFLCFALRVLVSFSLFWSFLFTRMFLEDLIYQQSAFFCVVCSVIVSLFLIASHLAYAFHTDIKTVPLLLLPRIRQIFFPLSSSSSALSRWLGYPQYHPHLSAPPLQPPLHACRIVMLVPVYAITSYLAFTYAEPSSSSFLRFSSLSSVDPNHPFVSPPPSLPAGSPSRRLSGNAEELGLPQKSAGEPNPPRLSWMTTRTQLGGTGSLQQRKWHLGWGVPRGVDTPQSVSGRSIADGGQEGTKSNSSSMGGVIEEKLGVDFESLGKGTGGCLGFTLHAIRDMYEVYVLYSFIALLVAVLGGEEEAVEQLHLKVWCPDHPVSVEVVCLFTFPTKSLHRIARERVTRCSSPQ